MQGAMVADVNEAVVKVLSDPHANDTVLLVVMQIVIEKDRVDGAACDRGCGEPHGLSGRRDVPTVTPPHVVILDERNPGTRRGVVGAGRFAAVSSDATFSATASPPPSYERLDLIFAVYNPRCTNASPL